MKFKVDYELSFLTGAPLDTYLFNLMQMDPSYRPSLMDTGLKESGVAPFAGSDLVLSPSMWSSHVVGK